MGKTSFFKIYYIVIPVLTLGITMGYTTFAMALVALVPILFLTTRHTVGLFFVMYGGVFGGVIRTMYPAIPIYGLLLMFIGLLLLRDVIRELFQNNSRIILLLVLTLILFGFFYLIGPRDEFSSDKYLKMCINGFFTLVGYYVLARSEKIKAEELASLLILVAICMMTFVINQYSFVRGGLFDFNWFREQCVQYDYEAYRNEHDSMLIGYQNVGMTALYGCAIYLSQIKLKTANTCFYIVFILLIVLTTGCRQALLGVAVVLFLRYAVFRLDSPTGNSFNRLIWIVIGAVVLSFSIDFLVSYSDVVSRTLSDGDAGRYLHYAIALVIFKNSPIVGAGIGGFHAFADLPWPHNFFLELLCECGIIGTVLFLGILIVVLVKNKVKLLTINSSNMFFFLVLIALLVRVMVSSDFRESIELFTAVFAVTATSNMARNNLLEVRKPKRK